VTDGDALAAATAVAVATIDADACSEDEPAALTLAAVDAVDE
jgi:hypothetical protein